MSVERIYIGCDMEAPYGSVSAAGATVTGGTVTWALLESDRATLIDSGDCPEDGSTGDYVGVIESTVTADLIPRRRYWVRYTLVSGNVNDVQWVECVAAYRDAQ
jgi:hypothetical protein